MSLQVSSEWGKCAMLINLQMARNKIFGRIHIELGNLTKLEVLQLDSNEFIGDIPTELENSVMWVG